MVDRLAGGRFNIDANIKAVRLILLFYLPLSDFNAFE
jgi:hypothetical protein